MEKNAKIFKARMELQTFLILVDKELVEVSEMPVRRRKGKGWLWHVGIYHRSGNNVVEYPVRSYLPSVGVMLVIIHMRDIMLVEFDDFDVMFIHRRE